MRAEEAVALDAIEAAFAVRLEAHQVRSLFIFFRFVRLLPSRVQHEDSRRIEFAVDRLVNDIHCNEAALVAQANMMNHHHNIDRERRMAAVKRAVTP